MLKTPQRPLVSLAEKRRSNASEAIPGPRRAAIPCAHTDGPSNAGMRPNAPPVKTEATENIQSQWSRRPETARTQTNPHLPQSHRKTLLKAIRELQSPKPASLSSFIHPMPVIEPAAASNASSQPSYPNTTRKQPSQQTQAGRTSAHGENIYLGSSETRFKTRGLRPGHPIFDTSFLCLYGNTLRL